MKASALPVSIALLFALAGCSHPEAQGGSKPVALSGTAAKSSLTVSSSDIAAGQPIPDRFTDYGDKQTPIVSWSSPPAGTKSLVLLLEDPDAPGSEPFVHWIVTGIPADASSVGPKLPAGAAQGKNSEGTTGYYGPHPPQGDPPHHYHFEVFALDNAPPYPANADRTAVLSALQGGHVLAAGEMVATYAH